MKKLLIVLISFLGLTFSANAQVAECKISDGIEGSTVIASITDVEDGLVIVELENDGDFPVNVTVTIYTSNYPSHTRSRGTKVYPNQTNVIEIQHPDAGIESDGDEPNDFRIKVGGNRCS